MEDEVIDLSQFFGDLGESGQQVPYNNPEIDSYNLLHALASGTSGGILGGVAGNQAAKRLPTGSNEAIAALEESLAEANKLQKEYKKDLEQTEKSKAVKHARALKERLDPDETVNRVANRIRHLQSEVDNMSPQERRNKKGQYASKKQKIAEMSDDLARIREGDIDLAYKYSGLKGFNNSTFKNKSIALESINQEIDEFINDEDISDQRRATAVRKLKTEKDVIESTVIKGVGKDAKSVSSSEAIQAINKRISQPRAIDVANNKADDILSNLLGKENRVENNARNILDLETNIESSKSMLKQKNIGRGRGAGAAAGALLGIIMNLMSQEDVIQGQNEDASRLLLPDQINAINQLGY